MQIEGHSNDKYRTGHRLSDDVEWLAVRVELWRHKAGRLADLTLEYTEVAILLDGNVNVKRTGDGEYQEAFGRPGAMWICPAGTYESDIELSATMTECLHIFLPPTLLEHAALEEYDIDPGRARLGYAGGVTDTTVVQIGSAFRNLLARGYQQTDRLFVDGMRTALAAHLVSGYTAELWKPATRPCLIDPRRFKRVLDFIEANLASTLTLEELAAEACLSPFHFSRVFRQATGLTPHRYVMEKRIEVAKHSLSLGRASLVEIALDTGFGSQPNFNRVFRRATGLSPGQFRDAGRR